MREKWTGDLIGKMHNADITFDELGAELGWGKSYISMILNGTRTPTGAQEKMEAAFESIVERKNKEG